MNIRHTQGFLNTPLGAWAVRHRRQTLSPAERIIAARHDLPPRWARLVCDAAGIGGGHD